MFFPSGTMRGVHPTNYISLSTKITFSSLNSPSAKIRELWRRHSIQPRKRPLSTPQASPEGPDVPRVESSHHKQVQDNRCFLAGWE